MNNFIRFPIWFLVAVLMTGFIRSAAAEPVKEEPFRMKTISGQVIAKTRVNFSLEFDKTKAASFEAIMPFNDKTKLIGYKSITDMQRGDMVRVEAKEYYRIDKEGKEVVTATWADSIMLTKRSTASGRLTSQGGAV